MPDDLIEVMAKALRGIDDFHREGNVVDRYEHDVLTILTAIESAGYVVGRMRWEGEGGSHLWLQSGGFGLAWVQVTNPGKANEMATAYLNSPSLEKVGHFGSALEARAACDAAVRKAMIGE